MSASKRNTKEAEHALEPEDDKEKDADKDDTLPPSRASTIEQGTICRICQLDESESDEPIKDLTCHCLGALKKCHKSCQIEWLQKKRNNVCELCKVTFSDVDESEVVTPSVQLNIQMDTAQTESEVNAREALPRINDNRKCVGLCVLILFVATSLATALTVQSHSRLQEATAARKTEDARNEQFVFGLCLTMSVVSFCFLVTSSMVWLSVIWRRHRFIAWRRRRAQLNSVQAAGATQSNVATSQPLRRIVIIGFDEDGNPYERIYPLPAGSRMPRRVPPPRGRGRGRGGNRGVPSLQGRPRHR